MAGTNENTYADGVTFEIAAGKIADSQSAGLGVKGRSMPRPYKDVVSLPTRRETFTFCLLLCWLDFARQICEHFTLRV